MRDGARRKYRYICGLEAAKNVELRGWQQANETRWLESRQNWM